MNKQKLKYLFYCLRNRFSRNSCPSCNTDSAFKVDEKIIGIVTLLECQRCHLKYRFPQDSKEKNYQFYQKEYELADLTDLPDEELLNKLKATSFLNSRGKDFSSFVPLLKSISEMLGKKLSIIDYGANWGYACYQFEKLDFVDCAIGFELSKRARDFGEKKLGINYIDAPHDHCQKFNLMFSSHVIEHMDNPAVFKSSAEKLLSDQGVILMTCPNGSESARSKNKNWSLLWGENHPNFISDDYLIKIFENYGGVILGPELLDISHKEISQFLKNDLMSLSPETSSLYLLAQKKLSSVSDLS